MTFFKKTNTLISQAFKISFCNTYSRNNLKIQCELLHSYGEYKLLQKAKEQVENFFMYKIEPKKIVLLKKIISNK